jgi:hypothetical protein
VDALGNFEGVNTDGTNQSRTHNKQNQLTAAGSSTLTYDADGNMTTDETGRTFTYDAWNHPVQEKMVSVLLFLTSAGPYMTVCRHGTTSPTRR